MKRLIIIFYSEYLRLNIYVMKKLCLLLFLFAPFCLSAQSELETQFKKLKQIFRIYYPNQTFEFDYSDCILYLDKHEIRLACTNVEYFVPEAGNVYVVLFKCKDKKACIGDVNKAKDKYFDRSDGLSWFSSYGPKFKSSSAAIKFLNEAKKLVLLSKQEFECN